MTRPPVYSKRSVFDLLLGRRPAFNAVGNVDAVCPYCNAAINKKPGRKKKCPHCGNDIYVRTRPGDDQKVLVTIVLADVIDEQWSIVNGTHDAYLAKRQEKEKARSRLRKRQGSEPSDNDIQWDILQKEAFEHARAGNWGWHRNASFSMAEILRKTSKLNDALLIYLEVCYLDVCGPVNTGGRRENGFRRSEGLLAPGVTSRIANIICELGMSEKDMKSCSYALQLDFAKTCRYLSLPTPLGRNL